MKGSRSFSRLEVVGTWGHVYERLIGSQELEGESLQVGQSTDLISFYTRKNRKVDCPAVKWNSEVVVSIHMETTDMKVHEASMKTIFIFILK